MDNYDFYCEFYINDELISEKCEEELETHKECQIEISTDMNEEEIRYKCEIFESNTCMPFYRNLISSRCPSIESQNKFLKNFNEEKYNQYNNICDSLDEKFDIE
eukprot:jgi/Orpsp1_1/1183223/evm.model.c7180000084314.1